MCQYICIYYLILTWGIDTLDTPDTLDTFDTPDKLVTPDKLDMSES